jgi:hypothetical protein
MLRSQYYHCFYILNYSIHLKNQLIGPEIVCHFAGIVSKVPLHCRNCFLYCLIIPCNLWISRSQSRFCSRDIANTVFLYDGQKLRCWVVGVPPSSSPVPPPALDVSPAMSGDLESFPCASTFRDPAVDIPQARPIFPSPSSTFIHFTPSSFCFLDYSIRPISSIHFSVMVDLLRAGRMHSSMSVDIARHHSAFRSLSFLNKCVFNRVNVPHVTIDFLNVSFSPGVDVDQRMSVGVNFLNVLFFTGGTELSCS